MKFYIKERDNPQIGTYFVPMGKLSKAEAKRNERPLYGSNTMHPFDTEAEYEARLANLRKKGLWKP